MKLNKKAYTTKVFGFFFVLMLFGAIFFFGTFVMHYLLYDYGIVQVTGVADNLLNSTGEAMTNINALGSGFLGQTLWYDLLFLVVIVSAFIESTISAIKAKEEGFLSFFGFITIGNVFLIFVMFYASQIQGWLLNEILYNVLLVNVSSPIMTAFFNYGMYIGVLWYLWLIAINQLDFADLKERFQDRFGRNKLTSDEGRYEE